METIIEVNNVSKAFKDKKAVDGVSIQVEKGSIVALLGPNGAGKTTTMLMMLGLLKPTSGSIKLFGQEPGSTAASQRIGAMLQEVSVMDRLKVKELIELFRSYYPNPADTDYLKRVSGLQDRDMNRYAEKLSGGQKRSLSYALALSGDPDLLFFDEPTVGLDITARREFWKNVKELAASGKTILFSTHYLQEADDVAHRIILFNQGKLVADGTPQEIKSRLLKRSVSFIPLMPEQELNLKLNEMDFADNHMQVDGRVVLTTDNTDHVLESIFRHQWKVRDIQIDSGSLDEAFEQLTVHEKESIL
ncbi:ABC transporter ATP-binding protein [Paenibacillus puldeungensis]|uniref:ABC transporter ATP-binding protein n=1 Tax=Paenibacillus puldeungensis TaxID=696536 RepID=A0ABW3S5Y2_9BACL